MYGLKIFIFIETYVQFIIELLSCKVKVTILGHEKSISGRMHLIVYF